MVYSGDSAKRETRAARDVTCCLNSVRVGLSDKITSEHRDVKEARKQILFMSVGKVLHSKRNRKHSDLKLRAHGQENAIEIFFLTRHKVFEYF